MSKKEFLDQLSELLSDLSPEDKEEALSYYKEYIEDAGLENEAAILKELGSVSDLAKAIKIGLSNRDYSEEGSWRNFYAPETKSDNFQQDSTSKDNSYEYSDSTDVQKKNASDSTSRKNKLILAVIIAAFLAPVWLPVAGTIFSVVITVIVIIACVLLVASILGFVLAIASIILFAIGLFTLLTDTLLGITLVGVSLVLAASAILFILLSFWIFGKVMPLIFNSISNLIYRVFHHSKEVS